MQILTINLAIINYKQRNYEFVSLEIIDETAVLLFLKNETENATYRLSANDTKINNVVCNSATEIQSFFA